MTIAIRIPAAFAAAALAAFPAAPLPAQQIEGDALSPIAQVARMRADAGTFWLDGSGDRELIRYTTPRDVRLCLPEPSGPGAAERGYPLRITWDQTNTVTLYPGNCMFFDARRVTVSPATELPSGVVLTGTVEAARALQP